MNVTITLLLQGTKGEIGVLGPPGPPGKKVLHPGVWHQRAHMHARALQCFTKKHATIIITTHTCTVVQSQCM